MITPEISTTSLSFSDNLRIAALGIGMQGEYGAVTDIAREFGVSRPTVYEKTRRGQAALEEAFSEPEGGKVWTTVTVDEAQLRRAIVSAYVEGPNSMRDIQALVEKFYGLHVGYGKVFEILQEAMVRAAVFNSFVPLDAVKVAALDELFSQGDPVFAGIDLDTDYLFLLEHHLSRGGDDWAAALKDKKLQGLDLETVVKDAGTGLAAGTTSAYPNAKQRDDLFHARWKMGQVQQWLEKKAWGQMEQLIEAEETVEKARREGATLYSVSQKLRRVRERYEKVVGRHDQFERLKEEADHAMEFIDLNSMLPQRGSEQAARLKDIAEQMAALGGKKIRSLACYLKNRADGLAEHIDHIWEKLDALAEEIPGAVVPLCCQLWRRILELRRCPQRLRREHRERAKLLIELIIVLTGDRANEVVERAFAVLRKAHRASSAVENFNALLRPYLHVHKRVSQGFLDLFMAWRNLRTRPMGKHKGTSAYELLTGEKVDDWLTMLGYPPSELAH